MPEKGWKTITIRENTAKTIRENAKIQKMTIDVYINHLMTIPQMSQKKTGLVKCELCPAMVKPENLDSHISRVHPEHLFKQAH